MDFLECYVLVNETKEDKRKVYEFQRALKFSEGFLASYKDSMVNDKSIDCLVNNYKWIYSQNFYKNLSRKQKKTFKKCFDDRCSFGKWEMNELFNTIQLPLPDIDSEQSFDFSIKYIEVPHYS